jgi:hypothetical protein
VRGAVAWWRGGVVAWWRGGVVAWWRGGVVAWWRSGVGRGGVRRVALCLCALLTNILFNKETTGLEVLKAVKEKVQLQRIPFIFIITPSGEKLQGIKNIGADDYLVSVSVLLPRSSFSTSPVPFFNALYSHLALKSY